MNIQKNNIFLNANCSSVPQSVEHLRINRKERFLAKVLQLHPNHFYGDDLKVRYRLKQVVTGANYVKQLLSFGMEVPFLKILSYLGWFQLALVLIMAGPSYPQLPLLAGTLVKQICIVNSHLNDKDYLNWSYSSGKKIMNAKVTNLYINPLKNITE